MVNIKWIQAILRKLEEILTDDGVTPKRFFVLSVMGVQSSGKSTLLNIMFGVQLKTSVGQCTRGINMQLIPVQGRAEYDYILLLDTEGTRAPEYWGLPGSEKRDNQMATLSILLADATIIVNPGENDAAIKEILPIVLLAYQGSKLAEEKGGRLSSMMFFVYNRIDTTQKDKLGNILQILGTSLNEAFHKVSQLSGIVSSEGSPLTRETSDKVLNPGASASIVSDTGNNKGISLFRRFQLDSSNSSGSDVRIVGNIKKNFTPPDDVPDSAYGEALCEFREHIHMRVTVSDPVAALTKHQEWTSRSLIEILEYLDLVWVCIRSADFTLNFKTVMERAAFDQLSREYKKCEKELTSVCYDAQIKIIIILNTSVCNNAQIEKEILAKKLQVQVINDVEFDTLKRELENQIKGKEIHLDNQVKEVLEQPGHSNWKTDFENKWTAFKSTEKQRWFDRIRTFFHCQLKYDLHITESKKAMRLSIRELFTDDEAKRWSEEKKNHEFDQLFQNVLAKAEEDYPPILVKESVNQVYFKNNDIKALQINLYNHYTVEDVMTDLETVTTKLIDQLIRSEARHFILLKMGHRWQNREKNPRKMLLEIFLEILKCVQYEHAYMDQIVDNIIDITLKITKRYQSEPYVYLYDIEYAHILAKALAIRCLERRQKDWESVNSVSAKLRHPSTKQEMKAYFNAVSQGIVATELLVNSLTANLQNILPEAFDKEMIRYVDLRVRTKTWLSDPKALQARLDLALLKLMDEGKIEEMLDKIENSAEFYEQVLTDLISNEISEVEKMCEVFNATFKDVINSAVVVALSVKSGRAKEFIDELKSQCLKKFRDNYLAINLITDGDGYEGCDNEEENVFLERCLQLVPLSSALKSSDIYSLEWREKLSRQVLSYMQNVRREEVARPRCKAYCPICGSLCIHPANHDTSKIKHDTYHQPAGLNGFRFADSKSNSEIVRNTSWHRTCSTSLLENCRFWHKVEYIPYGDFSKIFPDWMSPRLMERLPLREYIFANYQEQIAEKYQIKKCVTIPADYYYDLETIRSNLKRDANLTQDK